MTTKSERLRFTNEDDLVLLREVTSLNPYEDKERWKTIAERVGVVANKNFSIRAVRDHVENLLKNWIKINRANLKKSGIEEEYTEKEQLLQEIEDLQREYKGTAASRKSNNSNLQNRGIQARDIALRNVNLSETTSELEFQELSPSISSTNAPSRLTFSPLSLSPATLQQNFIPSTYSNSTQDFIPSTDILSINTETHCYSPEPILSPRLAASPGPIPSSAPVSSPSPVSVPSPSSVSVPSPLLSAFRTPLSTLQTGPIRNIRNKVRGGLKNSTLHFLEDKHNKDIQLEKQKLQIEGEKLQLEGEKLQLEKAKFELERKERETRLELESEERRHSIVVADQQKHFMEILLHLIDKSKT